MDSPTEILEFVLVEGYRLGGSAGDVARRLWGEVTGIGETDSRLDFHPVDAFSDAGIKALIGLGIARRDKDGVIIEGF